MNNKILIYQIFTRLYGNSQDTCQHDGSVQTNGTGKFKDFDQKTLKRLYSEGYSHLWFTGVIRHASKTDFTAHGIPAQHPAIVKGKAGSPYAIVDYYDVDPDLAVDVDKRMEEFEALMCRTHKAGMKVIIDFVPNHVARQYKSICQPDGVKSLGEDDNTDNGFDPQNNFYYCPGCRFEPYLDLTSGGTVEPYEEYPAKATGNDHFDNRPGANDWYETVKLNYGVDYWTGIGHFDPIPDTWHKMLHILLYWAEKGVDGFRCDMAEMVPAEFWTWATEHVKYAYPEIIFVGEVYDPNKYRRYINSGFDYLYDKVGMYDTMRGVVCGYLPARDITHAWQNTNDIGSHMLYFMENHDEQRVASDFFAGDAEKGIPGMAASVLMRSNPFMLYAGEEYGEQGMDAEGFSGKDGRTTIFDYWSVGTLRRAKLKKLTNEEKRVFDIHKAVLAIARKEKAVDGDFYDLMYVNPYTEQFDDTKQFAFLRKKDNEVLLIVSNFSAEDREVVVNIPFHAVTHLDIPIKQYKAKDLLSKDTITVDIDGESRVPMTVKGYGVRVWKFVTSKTVK